MTLQPRVFCRLGLAAIAFLTLASPLRTAHAQLGNDYVRIEVKVEAENDKKSNKPVSGTPANNQAGATVTQERTLQISLSGKPHNPENRKGKWAIYSKGVKDKDVVMVDSGDFKLELPANGEQKIESKKVNLTFTPTHVAGTSGNSRAVGKKVEAVGSKYYGYSVVIKDGDNVVGETYDPPGLKQELTRK